MKIVLLLKGKKYTGPTFTGWKLQDRIRFQGMNISIENKKGSTRRGIGEDGKPWKTTMIVPYGYLRETIGADKDHVDVFVGSNDESDDVFVIHQIDPRNGKFDEDKVMLGFSDYREAKEMYLRHYDRPDYFGSMTTMTMAEFKDKAFNTMKGRMIK